MSGWWWLWWGGSWFPRAYTAPYLSFLSLQEGGEGPRSRALRTEFIIDRAIPPDSSSSVSNGGGIVQIPSISPAPRWRTSAFAVEGRVRGKCARPSRAPRSSSLCAHGSPCEGRSPRSSIPPGSIRSNAARGSRAGPPLPRRAFLFRNPRSLAWLCRHTVAPCVTAAGSLLFDCLHE